MLGLNLRAFENKKYSACDRFHGNGPYGEIPTKKQPIRTLGFAVPYNNGIYFIDGKMIISIYSLSVSDILPNFLNYIQLCYNLHDRNNTSQLSISLLKMSNMFYPQLRICILH